MVELVEEAGTDLVDVLVPGFLAQRPGAVLPVEQTPMASAPETGPDGPMQTLRCWCQWSADPAKPAGSWYLT